MPVQKKSGNLLNAPRITRLVMDLNEIPTVDFRSQMLVNKIPILNPIKAGLFFCFLCPGGEGGRIDPSTLAANNF